MKWVYRCFRALLQLIPAFVFAVLYLIWAGAWDGVTHPASVGWSEITQNEHFHPSVPGLQEEKYINVRTRNINDCTCSCKGNYFRLLFNSSVSHSLQVECGVSFVGELWIFPLFDSEVCSSTGCKLLTIKLDFKIAVLHAYFQLD